MKTLFTTLLLTISSLSFSQVGAWKTNKCYSHEHVYNYAPMSSIYNLETKKIKLFKRKYLVHFKVEAITIGDTMIRCDIDFKKKVRYETDLIQVNDTLSYVIQIARSRRNGEDILLYNISILKRKDKCWHYLASFGFGEVLISPIRLTLNSAGIWGSPDFTQINKGVLEIK
jgi:hypothetical protein